ncbi:plasmid replication initiator-like protein [Candidatus Regiella endosymbiont of Tuberolachnus salignus]|uniref:plasmid replication initiator-like protein n=1 Tax=Candidatus Regiella endosymbiont of Tuberolachnus salignus TaxID=3077956 RepID=UPI0030CD130C
MEKESVDDLRKKLSKTRNLLNLTTDKLNDVIAEQRRTKNFVPGGYYMMSREAEKNLRALQQESPAASLVFSIIREHMQIGTNAVTISNRALCKIIDKSRATITRAVSHLAKHNYVQIIKTGNVNTYVVNEKIAFSGSPFQRKAVFSATIVAHECEQEKGWEEVKKLKAVPVIYSENEISYD